jgi:predicted nucleic acid-binding protein
LKLVDSSGWIELLSDGPLADTYLEHLADPSLLLIPTIVMYEVYRWTKRVRGEESALLVVASMEEGTLVPLTPSLALTAADLGLEHRLAMADALVYATALTREAELITSDVDFAQLPRVTYLPKQ